MKMLHKLILVFLCFKLSTKHLKESEEESQKVFSLIDPPSSINAIYTRIIFLYINYIPKMNDVLRLN